MVKLTNSCEGVTPSGTAAVAGSGGNTGGISGNFFDTVLTGTASTVVSSSAHAAHGSLSYHLSTPASADFVDLAWSTSITGGPYTTLYSRVYAYLTANPATTWEMVLFGTSGAFASFLRLNTTGNLFLADANTSPVATFTAAVPLGAWFRIEFDTTGSAAAGVITARLYTAPDSTAPAETRSVTGQNTAGALAQVRFGPGSNLAPANASIWLDDLAVSSDGPLGPSVSPGGADLYHHHRGRGR